jgi:hypothetical protein
MIGPIQNVFQSNGIIQMVDAAGLNLQTSLMRGQAPAFASFTRRPTLASSGTVANQGWQA